MARDGKMVAEHLSDTNQRVNGRATTESKRSEAKRSEEASQKMEY